MTWTIYRRDSELRRTGVLPFVRLEAAMRWNRPSRCIIDTNTVDVPDIQLGEGIIVSRDGSTVLSGIVAEKTRTVEGDDDRVELVVVDEIGRIAARRIHPDPSVAADGAQAARDVRSGPAGQVIAEFVDANAGPSALEPRRIPGLVVPSSSEGGAVTGRGRWNQLVEFCAVLADRGDVGFRAVQELGLPAAIRFEIVVPQDRAEARFDVDGLSGSGSLSGWQARAVLPEFTVAIAGGRGELDGRLVRVGEDGVGQYGWWEQWLDRNNAGDEDDVSSQEAELDAAIADGLREGAVRADLDLQPVDSPALRWRTHFDLGDRVRVLLDGQWQWRQVRGVDVAVGADGEEIAPLLGDASRSERLRFLERIGAVEQQVDERGRN